MRGYLLVQGVKRLPAKHVPSAWAVGQTVRFACGKNNHHQKKKSSSSSAAAAATAAAAAAAANRGETINNNTETRTRFILGENDADVALEGGGVGDDDGVRVRIAGFRLARRRASRVSAAVQDRPRVTRSFILDCLVIEYPVHN